MLYLVQLYVILRAPSTQSQVRVLVLELQFRLQSHYRYLQGPWRNETVVVEHAQPSRRMNRPTKAVLSPELKAFYESHNVNVESLLSESGSSVRFIRLNPRFSAKDTLSQLPDAKPIPWLHPKFGFYSIPARMKLQQSECFRSGRVYGMDVSSGAAVAVLMSNLYDKESCHIP